MMRKTTHILIAIAVLLFAENMLAQKHPKNVEDLAKSYTEYFKKEREIVFLQLNKTVLSPKEDIWFSAYVFYPRNSVAANTTTSLKVSLYDEVGTLLDEKDISIKSGYGSGSFSLGESYEAGKYVIKAVTNYMSGLREKQTFSQSFTILGKNEPSTTAVSYDLQLLPEGGHLIANTTNSIGVKLVDQNGEGLRFENGKIINSAGSVVNTFKSNSMGMAQFRFNPTYAENYTAILTTEKGDTIKQNLSKPEILGLTMSVNTMMPEVFVLSVRTNQKTFSKIKGNKFYLVYHRSGQMKGLEFSIPQSLTATIRIAKKDLFSGMNIVTIFDNEMEPLLERLVFNWNGVKRKNVEASISGTERNSLVINLNGVENIGKHSLSVSVLPSETKSYHPRNNIFSAFYIEPYIKGDLLNGSYYFSQETNRRRRNYDLNLLLVTQGWSKYTWGNIFMNRPGQSGSAMSGNFTIIEGNNTAAVEAVDDLVASGAVEKAGAAEKEYYAPKYNSYSSPAFKYYGVIDWFPHTSLEGGKATLKVVNTLQPEIVLFIEGMTKEGALISEKIKVKTAH